MRSLSRRQESEQVASCSTSFRRWTLFRWSRLRKSKRSFSDADATTALGADSSSLTSDDGGLDSLVTLSGTKPFSCSWRRETLSQSAPSSIDVGDDRQAIEEDLDESSVDLSYDVPAGLRTFSKDAVLHESLPVDSAVDSSVNDPIEDLVPTSTRLHRSTHLFSARWTAMPPRRERLTDWLRSQAAQSVLLENDQTEGFHSFQRQLAEEREAKVYAQVAQLSPEGQRRGYWALCYGLDRETSSSTDGSPRSDSTLVDQIGMWSAHRQPPSKSWYVDLPTRLSCLDSACHISSHRIFRLISSFSPRNQPAMSTESTLTRCAPKLNELTSVAPSEPRTVHFG
jgi:hypothetical protein